MIYFSSQQTFTEADSNKSPLSNIDVQKTHLIIEAHLQLPTIWQPVPANATTFKPNRNWRTTLETLWRRKRGGQGRQLLSPWGSFVVLRGIGVVLYVRHNQYKLRIQESSPEMYLVQHSCIGEALTTLRIRTQPQISPEDSRWPTLPHSVRSNAASYGSFHFKHRGTSVPKESSSGWCLPIVEHFPQRENTGDYFSTPSRREIAETAI